MSFEIQVREKNSQIILYFLFPRSDTWAYGIKLLYRYVGCQLHTRGTWLIRYYNLSSNSQSDDFNSDKHYNAWTISFINELETIHWKRQFWYQCVISACRFSALVNIQVYYSRKNWLDETSENKESHRENTYVIIVVKY